MTPSRACAVDAGHGHVGQHPHDDEHAQDEEDPAADVGGAEGIDQRFEHGLLGRLAAVGVDVGGLVGGRGSAASTLASAGRSGIRASVHLGLRRVSHGRQCRPLR